MKAKDLIVILVIVAIATFALIGIVFGKPDMPPPPKKQDQFQYPNLNYESNWGKMSINRVNGEIIIREHPHWDGDAKFVTATKVYIVWYWIETGRPAPGIYDLKSDGTLEGVWNWDDEILIDTKTWEATGNLRADKIYPVK